MQIMTELISYVTLMRQNELDYARVYDLCDMHNIPLATNVATAEILIMAINRGDLDWRNAYK